MWFYYNFISSSCSDPIRAQEALLRQAYQWYDQSVTTNQGWVSNRCRTENVYLYLQMKHWIRFIWFIFSRVLINFEIVDALLPRASEYLQLPSWQSSLVFWWHFPVRLCPPLQDWCPKWPEGHLMRSAWILSCWWLHCLAMQLSHWCLVMPSMTNVFSRCHGSWLVQVMAVSEVLPGTIETMS